MQVHCPYWSRREFIRNLVALAGGVAAASPLRLLAQTPNPGRSLHVVIVGAGLAGLVCAYELEKRGHRVTILEADARHVGGRVRTLRFDNGLYGEAGAMRIPTRHDITRAYVREFGLPLRKFVYGNSQAYYFVRGERHRIADAKRVAALFQLREDERGKSLDDLWNDSVVKALNALGDAGKKDLVADAPRSAEFRATDQQSLLQLCQAAGLSDEAIELVMVTSGSESLLPFAATETLREELLEVWSQGFDEIVGGTDRIASAFAARLHSKPRMGCVVSALEQDPQRSRAAAIYRERGAERRVEGDFVLCTLPCPVLARIEVRPRLSAAKARAIRELNYDSSTKVLAIAQRRFWESEDGIYGGGTFTDLPIVSTYYPSDNAEAKDPGVSRGPGVLLASYSWGQPARRLASLAHPERSAEVLRHLARIHPQLRNPASVLRTASWSWDNHPWSGAAFTLFDPGQHTTLQGAIVAPEGRIYFAGEHASLAHSWMQGALESGLRATREMLAAAGAA
ncbi:MAG TPA: FAD-dependent oxidoreductase [Casimicrobiaceae bacterium]|nr:FAD-dependent oxidoreductase [Casimicrobiaceae bacterium]